MDERAPGSGYLGKDPYNQNFAKTDSSALNSIKNGQLNFGDLVSGGSVQKQASPATIANDSKSAKQSSPRSPIGRTDKRVKDGSAKVEPKVADNN